MAQLKNTTISDTGFLQLPVGTTAQRPAPAVGQMRFNTNAGKAEFYNATAGAWLGTAAAGVIATGGTVYDTDVEGTTYRVHVFTSTGNSTFTVTKGGEVEYLMAAGGAAASKAHTTNTCGGGGAGGVIIGTTTIMAQPYTISVGAGGTVSTASGNRTGTNGSNSVAFDLTAIGGGFGGPGTGLGGNGGSGGGAGSYNGSATAARAGGLGTQPGSASGGFGNNGGSHDGTLNRGGCGGGGAGSPGEGTGLTETGTNGGIGIASFIAGISTFYAAGGASSGWQNSPGGVGGIGGGGNGGSNSSNGTAGTPNTGSGGGAAKGTTIAGDGGSGIVIIRYPLRQENPVTAAGKTIGDGVVLDLDFAKPTVYAGAGTTVSDSRLNGVTGTLINSPVFADPRTHRSNFTFNGVDNVIQFTGSNLVDRGLISNRPFSIVFWGLVDGSNPSSLNFFNNIHPEISGAVAVQIFYDPSLGNLAYATRNVDGGYVQITSAINLNQWYHICATREASGNWRAYLNGTIVGTIASVRTDFGNITDGIFLGRRSGTTFPLGGKIGFYQFYDQRLTDSQVAQQYNATRWRFGV